MFRGTDEARNDVFHFSFHFFVFKFERRKVRQSCHPSTADDKAEKKVYSQYKRSDKKLLIFKSTSMSPFVRPLFPDAGWHQPFFH